jgi:hypothetical protein
VTKRRAADDQADKNRQPKKIKNQKNEESFMKEKKEKEKKKRSNFNEDIVKLARKNDYFRQVLLTTELTQIVVMSIQPGETSARKRTTELTRFYRSSKAKGRR